MEKMTGPETELGVTRAERNCRRTEMLEEDAEMSFVGQAVGFEEIEIGCGLSSASGANSELDKEAEERTYKRDAVQYLKIFPVELWAKLFEHVKDPTDLANLSNASLFFRKVLFDDRVVFLFPSVMMIMGEKLLKDLEREADEMPEEPSASVQPYRKCDTCGRHGTTEWFSGFLNLRLVCSVWCMGIGQLCQRDLTKVDSKGPNLSWAAVDFETAKGIQRFLQHFSITHDSKKNGAVPRSPFVSGCVELYYENNKNRMFTLFPSKYGQHVLRLDVDHRLDEPDCSMSYMRLRKWLGMMPQLRGLEYCNSDNNRAYEMAELGELVARFSLPKIDSLQLLNANSSVSIFRELIRSNNQLTSLQIDNLWFRQHHTSLLSAQSLNLTQLKTYCCSPQELAAMEKVSWPLEKLWINFWSWPEWEPKWSQVFRALGSNKLWQETLIDVELNMPYNYPNRFELVNSTLRECAAYRLELCQVKHFKIRTDYICSLDFLLPMKQTLETLRVDMHFVNDGTKRAMSIELLRAAAKQQVIQFLAHSDKMYDSNIWTLFPKLQKITCNVLGLRGKWNTFHRTKWEMLQSEAHGEQ